MLLHHALQKKKALEMYVTVSLPNRPAAHL